MCYTITVYTFEVYIISMAQCVSNPCLKILFYWVFILINKNCLYSRPMYLYMYMHGGILFIYVIYK